MRVMDWSDLAQDRFRWWALVNAVKNHRFSQNAGNLFNTCRSVRFSRRTLLYGVSN
jgi:hypothetical protein